MGGLRLVKLLYIADRELLADTGQTITGDRPFACVDDVISPHELAALSDSYKRVAGYDRESLQGKG